MNDTVIQEKRLEKRTDNYIRLIPTEMIFPGELFARTEYDPASFNYLCASIAANGIIEPLIVEKYMSGYRIISGDRRFYAAKRLKMERLPCIVRKSSPQCLELVMKMSSKNLSLFDKAEAIKALGGASAAQNLLIKKSEAEELLKMLDFSVKERIIAESANLSREVLAELLKVQGKAKRAKLLERTANDGLSPGEIRYLAKQKRKIRGNADIRLIANSVNKLCADFNELGVPLAAEIKKDCIIIKRQK